MEYLITEFFKAHPYLIASQVAKKAGINPSLMRQYISGKKVPSDNRLKRIAYEIHRIGEDLHKIKFAM